MESQPTGITQLFSNQAFMGSDCQRSSEWLSDDWAIPGLIQSIRKGGLYGGMNNGREFYGEVFFEIRSTLPFGLVRKIGSTHLIAISTAMRFAIEQAAHITALVFGVLSPREAVSLVCQEHLIRKLKNLDVTGDKPFGMDTAKTWNSGFLTPQFPKRDMAEYGALNDVPFGIQPYEFLRRTLPHYIISHERQHALQGHWDYLSAPKLNTYVGNWIGKLSDEEQKLFLWYLEANADQNSMFEVLNDISPNYTPGLFPVEFKKQGHFPEFHFLKYPLILVGVAVLSMLIYQANWRSFVRGKVSHNNIRTSIVRRKGGADFINFTVNIAGMHKKMNELSSDFCRSHFHMHERINWLLLTGTSVDAPLTLKPGACTESHTRVALKIMDRLAKVDKRAGDVLCCMPEYADFDERERWRSSRLTEIVNAHEKLFGQKSPINPYTRCN